MRGNYLLINRTEERRERISRRKHSGLLKMFVPRDEFARGIYTQEREGPLSRIAVGFQDQRQRRGPGGAERTGNCAGEENELWECISGRVSGVV